jgi:hypothetical protein
MRKLIAFFSGDRADLYHLENVIESFRTFVLIPFHWVIFIFYRECLKTLSWISGNLID